MNLKINRSIHFRLAFLKDILLFTIFDIWYDFYKTRESLEKNLCFSCLFNLCMSFDNFTHATAKLMDTFVFSQVILLKGEIYMFSTATLKFYY